MIIISSDRLNDTMSDQPIPPAVVNHGGPPQRTAAATPEEVAAALRALETEQLQSNVPMRTAATNVPYDYSWSTARIPDAATLAAQRAAIKAAADAARLTAKRAKQIPR